MFYKETEFKETPLGKIPRTWLTAELREVSEIKRGPFGGSIKKEIFVPKGFKVYEQKNVIHGDLGLGHYYIDEAKFKEMKSFAIREGDILLSAAGTIGKTVVVPKDFETGIINQALIKITLDNNRILVQFFNYLLNHEPYRKRVLGSSHGATMKNISSIRNLGSLNIHLPQVKEQREIVEVLSIVDLAIQKTCEVVAKTEHLKKGLMQKLLTEGIGHKEFKGTGIGKIPKEWDVVTYEQACERIFVGIATSSTKHFCKQGIPLIRNQNIREGSLDLSDLVYITEDFSEMNKNRMLKENDILSVRTGYPGLSCKVTKEMEGWHTFTTLIGRPILSEFSPDYLVSVLNSPLARSQILRLQAGLAQQNLNVRWIAKLKIPKPPIEEQQKISNILRASAEGTEAEKKVEAKLRRVKLALMDLLLTGKVRIRMDQDVLQ